MLVIACGCAVYVQLCRWGNGRFGCAYDDEAKVRLDAPSALLEAGVCQEGWHTSAQCSAAAAAVRCAGCFSLKRSRRMRMRGVQREALRLEHEMSLAASPPGGGGENLEIDDIAGFDCARLFCMHVVPGCLIVPTDWAVGIPAQASNASCTGSQFGICDQASRSTQAWLRLQNVQTYPALARDCDRATTA